MDYKLHLFSPLQTRVIPSFIFKDDVVHGFGLPTTNRTIVWAKIRKLPVTCIVLFAYRSCKETTRKECASQNHHTIGSNCSCCYRWHFTLPQVCIHSENTLTFN